MPAFAEKGGEMSNFLEDFEALNILVKNQA